jgi:hypothetical protein
MALWGERGPLRIIIIIILCLQCDCSLTSLPVRPTSVLTDCRGCAHCSHSHANIAAKELSCLGYGTAVAPSPLTLRCTRNE